MSHGVIIGNEICIYLSFLVPMSINSSHRRALRASSSNFSSVERTTTGRSYMRKMNEKELQEEEEEEEEEELKG